MLMKMTKAVIHFVSVVVQPYNDMQEFQSDEGDQSIHSFRIGCGTTVQ